MLLSSTDEPMVLAAAPVSVTLRAPDDAARSGKSQLAARLLSLPRGAAIYLLLEGLRTPAAPGVTYNVYLGLLGDEPAAGPEDPRFAGTFSFFDASGQPTDGGGASAAFDVTDLTLSLAETGALTNGLTLRIEPAGRPSPEAEPVIGRISLIAQ